MMGNPPDLKSKFIQFGKGLVIDGLRGFAARLEAEGALLRPDGRTMRHLASTDEKACGDCKACDHKNIRANPQTGQTECLCTPPTNLGLYWVYPGDGACQAFEEVEKK